MNNKARAVRCKNEACVVVPLSSHGSCCKSTLTASTRGWGCRFLPTTWRTLGIDVPDFTLLTSLLPPVTAPSFQVKPDAITQHINQQQLCLRVRLADSVLGNGWGCTSCISSCASSSSGLCSMLGCRQYQMEITSLSSLHKRRCCSYLTVQRCGKEPRRAGTSALLMSRAGAVSHSHL